MAHVQLKLFVRVVTVVVALVSAPRAGAEPMVYTVIGEREPVQTVPASVTVVDTNDIHRAQGEVSLAETAVRVPGIVAQDRGNLAEDLQVSSRGFGARAAFGIRGVRLLADGIPATLPDGQGQSAIFDLATAGRVEFLRGPYSVLYGNAAGGVIQVFTADGPPLATVSVDAATGSYRSRRAGSVFGGEAGGLNYIAGVHRFQTDGFRAHAAARRDHFNAKLKWELDDGATLAFVSNVLSQPFAQDPLGLTRTMMETDPRQAGSAAPTFDTGKTVHHRQAGVVYESARDVPDSLRIMGYAGVRTVGQKLAFRGDFGLSSGGIVNLDISFGGGDIRFTRRTRVFGAPLSVTAGIAYDRMTEGRRGFVNDTGRTGALRRDEADRVFDLDEYLQADWRLRAAWEVRLGLRHSAVSFDSKDFFVTANNPDDSGSVRFDRYSPVAGLVYEPNPGLSFYADYGHGFETPTLAELAYRPDGSSGLNLALRPANSDNVEAGIKYRAGPTHLEAVAYHVHTSDEIIVAAASGGRTSYANGGGTGRDGVELLAETDLVAGLHGYLAATWLRASFKSGAFTGKTVPGVPAASAYAELGWQQPGTGFFVQTDIQARSRVFVDEQNSEAAPGYFLAGAATGFSQHGLRWHLSEFVRLDNLFQRNYAGAVIVDDRNGRFYEPGPGRSWLAGIRISRDL